MMRLFARKKDAPQELDEKGEFSEEQRTPSTLELTHVGPYEIIAPIGSGGMGTVYKAIDRKRDQLVAIKVLDRRYDLDKKRRKQDYLGREVLIAASLEHPSIIRMHKEIVEQEDSNGNVRRCLVMELVDGHNLRKHIKDRDLSMNQMVDLTIRLCNGLDFLHQHGIVHRDIKPENFLFSRDMRKVKIVDFGLSKSNASWRTRWMREGGGRAATCRPNSSRKRSSMPVPTFSPSASPCTNSSRANTPATARIRAKSCGRFEAASTSSNRPPNTIPKSRARSTRSF